MSLANRARMAWGRWALLARALERDNRALTSMT